MGPVVCNYVTATSEVGTILILVSSILYKYNTNVWPPFYGVLTLKAEDRLNKNSARTSKRTLHITIGNISMLMLQEP
jgi:hypothetical protein